MILMNQSLVNSKLGESDNSNCYNYLNIDLIYFIRKKISCISYVYIGYPLTGHSAVLMENAKIPEDSMKFEVLESG